MRKVMVIVLVLIVALVAVVPALADDNLGPCNDSGEPGNSDYAQHHIVPLATQGGMGEDGHKPGGHNGFSACNPGNGQP